MFKLGANWENVFGRNSADKTYDEIAKTEMTRLGGRPLRVNIDNANNGQRENRASHPKIRRTLNRHEFKQPSLPKLGTYRSYSGLINRAYSHWERPSATKVLSKLIYHSLGTIPKA